MPYEHVTNIVFIEFELVKEYACKVYWLFTLNLPRLITVEPRLSGLIGTSVNSPDNRESG